MWLFVLSLHISFRNWIFILKQIQFPVTSKNTYYVNDKKIKPPAYKLNVAIVVTKLYHNTSTTYDFLKI